MAEPVVAVPTEYIHSDGDVMWYRRRWRQARPYTLPLPYETKRHFSKGVRSDGQSTGLYAPGRANQWDPTTLPDWSRYYGDATSRCYDRMKGQLGSQAGWGESLAQVNKTREMLTDRCVQLAHFVGALRRKDFASAARTLRTPKPSGATNKKALASNFLEYSYGWKPLVQDIWTSCDILQRPIGVERVRSSASSNHVYQYVFRDNDPSGSSGIDQNSTTKVTVKMGAEVSISNPNLWLANQLGLVNPVVTAWQILPWSLVVDWFINLEQYLMATSDFYGLHVTNAWTNTFYAGRETYTAFGGPYDPPDQRWSYGSATNGTGLTRVAGLTAPPLFVRPFRGFSLARAANAIGLVVSVLDKSR